jgi:hypothetical protein
VRRLPPALREAVLRRARGLCEYCHSQASLTGHEFTIDHIFPGSRGGLDDLENLCCCCSECNSHKQVRTEATDPRTGRVVSLFNPRSDRWDEHFRWSSTSTRIVGRTPVGRATVDALQLNRRVLVQARRVWAQYGLHPPQRRPLRAE